MHNETHSLVNLQDLIPTYFGSHNYKQHKPAKVRIKSYRFARVCFICACMNVHTQLELYLYDQLDIASFLLVFIAIPTPFLNFYLCNGCNMGMRDLPDMHAQTDVDTHTTLMAH